MFYDAICHYKAAMGQKKFMNTTVYWTWTSCIANVDLIMLTDQFVIDFMV